MKQELLHKGVSGFLPTERQTDPEDPSAKVSIQFVLKKKKKKSK